MISTAWKDLVDMSSFWKIYVVVIFVMPSTGLCLNHVRTFAISLSLMPLCFYPYLAWNFGWKVDLTSTVSVLHIPIVYE